jgi:hypothetical protein
MKNSIPHIIILIFILTGLSCKNILEPNAPLRERYVLTGVMRSDTTLQIVTVTHTYRPPGPNRNPNSYTDAPYIIGAEVNMWYKEKLYQLRDTILTRIDTSRYDEPVHCYYVNNLKPAPNEFIDIEALLPNGLLLQSTTKTPAADSLTFFDRSSDKVIPNQKIGNSITVQWKPIDKVLYTPRIEIVYYKSGDLSKHFKQVPLLYFDDNGVSTPIFPKTTSASTLSINLSTISQVLREISAGDENKKDYSISEMNLTVITYDPYLSSYYSSIQPPSNGFVVTLDEPDYTNIQGGYGIFGSYVKRVHRMTFTQSFLSQFGY